MNDTDVLTEFLKMPLGSTDEVFKKFAAIPKAIHRGNSLKQFLFVKGKRKDRVLLVAHADTVWDRHYEEHNTDEPKEITHTDGIIRNINGGLGADDRAGCAIVWLLKDMGHSILITNGEEHGRCGSTWLMDENRDIADEINSNHQFVVQFDRRNSRDFKCYKVGTDEFRAYVEANTGYSEPDPLFYTDIVTLCRDITGVNLSIGYYKEHTKKEYLSIKDWQNTLALCRRWLSEKKLPKFRR